MRHRPFGKGGPPVPLVGQGTWPMPDVAALRRGIELGMTHIDTAEMYGDGRSEELIAEAIAGVPRDSLFLVSKVYPHNADKRGIVRACERSLQRLRVDYLDCYLLHWRAQNDLAETMQGLEALVRAGKTRRLGVSNLDPWDLREAVAALQHERIACDQVLYNLEQRAVEDHELSWCREYGAALVAYSPLGDGGIDLKAARYAPLVAIAKRRNASPYAVALAFLLRDPSVFVIPKANRIEHVEANAAAGDLELDDREIAAIERAFPKKKRRGDLPMN
ncbi:MAG TPA: aldo/keto reductase [Candidatus Baltobacteraceae bacterium]|nr:aldo/keto reductase [Candidatus Baltobacteraceae bacterium]